MQNDKNFIGGNRRRQNDNKMYLEDKNKKIIDEMHQFTSILQTYFGFNDDIKAYVNSSYKFPISAVTNSPNLNP